MKIRIKDYREYSNMTQKELSFLLNIKQSTLSGYENGFRQPDFETLEKLADIFNTSIDSLLGYSKQDLYLIPKKAYEELLRTRDAINEIERINSTNSNNNEQKINIGTMNDNHAPLILNNFGKNEEK